MNKYIINIKSIVILIIISMVLNFLISYYISQSNQKTIQITNNTISQTDTLESPEKDITSKENLEDDAQSYVPHTTQPNIDSLHPLKLLEKFTLIKETEKLNTDKDLIYFITSNITTEELEKNRSLIFFTLNKICSSDIKENNQCSIYLFPDDESLNHLYKIYSSQERLLNINIPLIYTLKYINSNILSKNITSSESALIKYYNKNNEEIIIYNDDNSFLKKMNSKHNAQANLYINNMQNIKFLQNDYFTKSCEMQITMPNEFNEVNNDLISNNIFNDYIENLSKSLLDYKCSQKNCDYCFISIYNKEFPDNPQYRYIKTQDYSSWRILKK